MKKIILSVATASVLALSFTGCAKDGMAINTMGENRVDRYFQEGAIVEQKKVIINDRELAVLSGAGIGAGTGAIGGGMSGDGKAVDGALIGAVVGGVLGAIVGKEVEAYETTIQTKDQRVVGYLAEKLPLGTVVEYTIKDGKLKNVNVVAAPKVQTKNTKVVEKQVQKSTPKVETKKSTPKEVKKVEKQVLKSTPKVENKIVENNSKTTDDFWE